MLILVFFIGLLLVWLCPGELQQSQVVFSVARRVEHDRSFVKLAIGGLAISHTRKGYHYEH